MADVLSWAVLAELKMLLENYKEQPDGWPGEARDIAEEMLTLFEMRGISPGSLRKPSKNANELLKEIESYIKVQNDRE